MTAQFKINSLHHAACKDKMLTSSWVNYQEIHTTCNPGQQLVVDYQDFLGYILKMSIAHDETTLLSTSHANLTYTDVSGTGDDPSVDVTQISVHLAELGF